MSDWEQIEHEKGKWPKWMHFPRRFKLSCCHCQLVHDGKIKVDSRGRVWIKLKQNLVATAGLRKKK